jgi:hypothetical protein
MEETKNELQEKKSRLAELLESKSKANCDTRHLSASDVQREQEIEDLEGEIAELEKNA